ncbi:MAG: ABC transporter permease [Lachnospiraceae bacterium]|nr:ABC transporter permease [Lachnospiraceae bacterium]
MKTLLLVLRNLKTYIRKRNKYLYIAFFSTAIVVIGLLFVQGYYLEYTFNRHYKTEIVLELSGTQESNKVLELVKQVVNSEDLYSICLSSDRDDNTVKSVNGYAGLKVCGAYSLDFERQKSGGTAYEIASGENSLILGYSVLSRLEVDPAKPIYEQTFTDGRYSYTPCSITFTWAPELQAAIPPLLYAERYNTEKMTICLSSGVRTVKKGTLYQILIGYDFVKKIRFIDRTNPFVQNPLLSSYAVVYVIFLVFMINILILYYYWMNMEKDRIYIYRLTGAKQSSVMVLVLLETTFLYTSAMLFGVCLFWAINGIFKGKGLIYTESIVPYLYIVLVVFLILFVLSTIFAYRLSKQKTIYKSAE